MNALNILSSASFYMFTNYLIMLSGCLYGLTIGLNAYHHNKITEYQYAVRCLIPCIIGVVFLLMNSSIPQLFRVGFTMVLSGMESLIK